MSIPVNEFAGKTIAGCELIKELGRGSNGIVYLANQKKLNRPVACKIMFQDLQDDDPDYLDNILSEARNAAKLSHPNIIQALDAGNEDGIKYFIMEYVEGSSLEYIRTNTPEIISTKFLVRMAIQLANALDYAWQEHHMIHGDIKPGNILIAGKEQNLKLGDLGLARSGSSVEEDEEVMITPLYAAPEIITMQNKTPDPKSDIYSFGVMLYELACGVAPFTGSAEELLVHHLNTIPQALVVMNPDIDPDFAKLVDSMLAKDPGQRPADWKKVRAALQDIYSRLFPQTPAANNIVSTVVNAEKTQAKNTSWGIDTRKKNKTLEKMPWLIPAILILIILGALASIAINSGLI
ncbi:MAG: serine/threonine protein kinase [Lentisphaeria bacterium]|nr:serine/threonine protein kinase [Lentisphaeria bacterium]